MTRALALTWALIVTAAVVAWLAVPTVPAVVGQMAAGVLHVAPHAAVGGAGAWALWPIVREAL